MSRDFARCGRNRWEGASDSRLVLTVDRRMRVISEGIAVAILTLTVLDSKLGLVPLSNFTTLADTITLGVRSEARSAGAVVLSLPASVGMRADIDAELFQSGASISLKFGLKLGRKLLLKDVVFGSKRQGQLSIYGISVGSNHNLLYFMNLAGCSMRNSVACEFQKR